MYAAAGGASLASRQARMRQKQQKKNQQLQAKLHPPKAPSLAGAEHGASTPTRQSRQFHQLPTSYLRAPQSHGRKLSASYTAQSKLLLPIDEGGDTQSVLHMRMHSHAHLHPMQHSHLHGQITPHQTQPQQHHAIQGSYYQHFAAAAAAHGRVSPKLTHRHSGSSGGASFYQSNLPRSATATVPLVSQMEPTPPATPMAATTVTGNDTEQLAHISIPEHDSIIVTPATPIASPGHVAKLRKTDEVSAADVERQPLTAAEVDEEEGGDVDSPMQPPHAPLERKCSVYRMRRSDADEYGEGAASNVRRQLRELQFNNQQQQYEPLVIEEPQLMFKGLPNGRKYQPCAYCEEGICVCEHIECAQGRAAWLERGRRCSVQEREQQVAAAACHRRWVKRNRIQDASLGGSSDEEDFLGVLRGPSTFANAFLYVGLGTVALGLVIAFVGTGEKGFKTVELRLIGPSLIVLGLVCCILRILFCICPSHCIASRKKTRKKNGNKVDADHTTSLLRGESKRVSIARGPQPRYPLTHKRGNNKMLNEGMEALRQLATTSLFMQNEQKPSMNRVVPIIKEPENPIEAPLEMKKLDTELSVFEIANDATLNDESFHVRNDIVTSKPIEKKESARTASKNVVKSKAADDTTPKDTKAQATTTKKDSTYQLDDLSSIPTKKFSSAEQTATATSSKLARQPHTREKSQSLSSSSTVKDSIDGDQEMETSLTATKPTYSQVDAERTPIIRSSDYDPQAVTIKNEVEEATIDPPAPCSSATTRWPLTTAANSTTTSVSLYDIPPSTPHSYASSSIRTEPPLIRGPLGMPLAQLTASTSAYTMPYAISSNQATPTIAAPATTTTISLLPLPAPPLNTTASIPGQVIEPCENVAKNPIAARLSSPKGFTFSSPGRFNSSGIGGVSTLGKLVTQSSILASNRAQATTSATTSANASATSSSSLAPSLQTQQINKLEPELLLSPAKLGQ